MRIINWDYFMYFTVGLSMSNDMFKWSSPMLNADVCGWSNLEEYV